MARSRVGWSLALIGFLALLAAAAIWVTMWPQRPLALATEAVELSIEAGASPRDVAQAWVDAGVQTEPWMLYEWFRWSGQARRIRAGSYQIGAGITPRQLLDKMVRGEESLETLRIIEGWTLRQMREQLARTPHLKPLTRDMDEATLMAALGAAGTPAEGRFFPDTYAFSRGVSDLTVLKRAHQAMASKLTTAWAERAPDLPMKNLDEALILASIIEKETGRASERPQIASVFVNRLRIGMPLQTDRPDRDLRSGRAVRRQFAQARPARRHALQHLHPRRSAADADRVAGPGLAARRSQATTGQGAVLRRARRRQLGLQRDPRRP